MKSNKGFSLVELIVVIAIMAIIAAVAIPVYSTYVTKAENSVVQQAIDDAKYALELAEVEFGVEGTIAADATDATGKTVKITFTAAKGEIENAVDQLVKVIPNASEAASGDSLTFTVEHKIDSTEIEF